MRRTDLEDQSDAFLSRRWKAFLAIGIAPSIALQPSFDYVSNKYKSEEYSFVSDKPPQDVLGVFERLMTSEKDIKFFNRDNISLFLGPKIHLVAYPINTKNEFNLIMIIRKNLNSNILHDGGFFNDNKIIKKLIKDSAIENNETLKNIFDNTKEIKCLPTFVSDKIRQLKQRNIFFLGDSFYAPLPTFAQGASQSIESAYELFDNLNKNSIDKYFTARVKRIKMINKRSKINYFIFHLSNPIFVFVRNLIIKFVVNNKSFLNKYLGQIYSRH